MSRARLATGLLVLLALAGCSSSTSGSSVLVGSSSSEPTTTPVVVGPRTFELSEVNPCALIPTSARPALGLNQPETNTTDRGQPYCSLPSSTGASAGVFLVLDKNAADTAGAVAQKIVKTVTIDGFKIPLVATPGASGCSAIVYTSDAQYLSVQANGTGLIENAELCELVQPMVKVAIESLEKLQP